MKYVVTFSPENLINKKTVADWRYELKMGLLEKRGYYSDYSGRPITDVTGCHMHEWLVTRAMIPKGIWWHLLIFHEVNCMLLLPDEHIPQPPSREWGVQWAYKMYGRDVVRDWFYNQLPWKLTPPFELL